MVLQMDFLVYRGWNRGCIDSLSFCRGGFYKLYKDLISHLVDLGLSRVSHIKKSSFFYFVTYWFSATDLGHFGDLANEWTNYTIGLSHFASYFAIVKMY